MKTIDTHHHLRAVQFASPVLSTSLYAWLALACLLLIQPASATVTPQGWWHYGEVGNITDSSGNGRSFAFAFSCAGGGTPGTGVAPFGVGGPLGTTSFISTNSLYWTPLNCGAAAMWNPWGSGSVSAEWNPPPTNYTIECYILPEEGRANNSTWFFASGSGDFSQPSRDQRTGPGGVYFRWDYNGGAPRVGAFVIPNASQGVPTEVQIGDWANGDYTKWMHVAVVNTDGTNAFYVNGVQKGASTSTNTIPNGNIFAGGSPGTTPSFKGWMDELRITTFAPGAFSVSDLLTRPAGPNLYVQPQSTTVWDGGAAPFTVVAALDASITYQWQRAGTNLPGETSATLVVPQVSLADSGAQFRCVLTASSISVTSSPATLTVIPNRTEDVNYFRASITGQPGVAAYFPVDHCLGLTVSNIVDVTRDGMQGGVVRYDGRTNRAFGQRALTFDAGGYVQIPNNPAFEFSGGNGTIEALMYLESGAPQDGTIFAWAYDGSTVGYALLAKSDGTAIIYSNDSPALLSWSVPVNLVGRLAHVAVVIENTTNVTVVLDGQSLGTKTQTGLGAANSAPVWIGAIGTTLARPLKGTVDEIAVYGNALSLNTIQVHYSRFVYGTNVTAPSIVSQSGSRTVIAGTAPILKVQVAGTLPISYQWTSNGVAIPGANAPTYKVASTTNSTGANFTLFATNDVGWTNSQPIAINFVAPPSPYSAAVASDRPIAYWRLNEASGPTAIDSAGYFDATYFGTVTFGAPAVMVTETDPAVDFAGNSGRAQLSNVPELNPTGPFSVEAWTRPNAGAAGIVLSSQNRNNSRAGYSIHANIFIAQYGIDLGAPNATVTRYNTATTPQAGVPVHLVFTYDGTNGSFYVNGLKASSPLNNFVNNTVAPLTIGKRSDNAAPWNGVVDEVAFYDYALSDARVTNHWSFSWSASAVTQQPVGVTTNEWSTMSLTVAASGYPNTYQWYKVGTGALTDVNNPDGTRHYPNGTTNTTLTITQTHPVDSGQYYAMVINSLGNSQSSNATVLITAETTKPTVAYAAVLPTPNPNGTNAPFLVRITFSERVDPVTAAVPGNYVFNGGASASLVTLSADSKSAYLSAGAGAAGLTPGQKYTILVSGVKDQAQTPNTIEASTPVFVWAPTFGQGLVWDFYANITPQGIVNLLSSPYYPNAPTTNVNLAKFDSTPVSGPDNYGCSLSGWITPTVTTNYYFFLASDDASELQLSSDANPVNAQQIASFGGARATFVEPGVDSSVSGPMPLTAGVSYFIRALQTEGGGGDYVKVAWKMQDDPIAAASLLPISGSVLSSYGPLPAPKFSTPVLSGNQLTISWVGSGSLYESSDLVNWTLVPGNPSSPYQVNITSAPQKFYAVVRQ